VLECCLAPSRWPWLSLGERSCRVQHSRPCFGAEPDSRCSLRCRGEEETTLRDALPEVGWGWPRVSGAACPRAAAWSWADGAGAAAVPGLGGPASPGGCEQPALGAAGTVYSVHTVLLLCQLPSGIIPPSLAAVLKPRPAAVGPLVSRAECQFAVPDWGSSCGQTFTLAALQQHTLSVLPEYSPPRTRAHHKCVSLPALAPAGCSPVRVSTSRRCPSCMGIVCFPSRSTWSTTTPSITTFRRQWSTQMAWLYWEPSWR